MASKKNRSRKANRRSPKAPATLDERLRQRFEAFIAWLDAHRWRAFVVGLVLLFVASLFGGYWLAGRLELRDSDRVAREALEDMKRGAPSEAAPKYARIEDIPGAREARYVIHAASIASPMFYRQYPLETLDANVWGLRRLLDFYAATGSLEGFLTSVEGWLRVDERAGLDAAAGMWRDLVDGGVAPDVAYLVALDT